METDVYTVDDGDDDGCCYNGTFDNSSETLHVGLAVLTVIHSWYRFDDVVLPNGATITAAHIELFKTSGGVWTDGPCETKVYAEAAANPDPPSDWADCVGRALTTEVVDWDFTAGAERIDSPDLVAVIQELVDSYDYSGGAAIQIHHRNDKALGNMVYSQFYTYEYINPAHYAPRLEISYMSPAAVFLTPRRFQGPL